MLSMETVFRKTLNSWFFLKFKTDIQSQQNTKIVHAIDFIDDYSKHIVSD